MIIDTSAWVEYLRATQSPTHQTLRSAVASDTPIATPAPVVMELLAGCATEQAVLNIQQLLARFEILEVEGLADFEDAALIQRTCRRKGETVRSMMDCLIAAGAAAPSGCRSRLRGDLPASGTGTGTRGITRDHDTHVKEWAAQGRCRNGQSQPLRLQPMIQHHRLRQPRPKPRTLRRQIVPSIELRRHGFQ